MSAAGRIVRLTKSRATWAIAAVSLGYAVYLGASSGPRSSLGIAVLAGFALVFVVLATDWWLLTSSARFLGRFSGRVRFSLGFVALGLSLLGQATLGPLAVLVGIAFWLFVLRLLATAVTWLWTASGRLEQVG